MKKIFLIYVSLVAMPAYSAATYNLLAANENLPLSSELLQIIGYDADIPQNEEFKLLQMEDNPNNNTPFGYEHGQLDVSAVPCPFQSQDQNDLELALLKTPYAGTKLNKTLTSSSSFLQDQASSSTAPYNIQATQNDQKPKIHPFLEDEEVWRLDETYYYRCICDSTYKLHYKNHSRHINQMHRSDSAKIEAEKKKNRKCPLCPKEMNFQGFRIHIKTCVNKKPSSQNSTVSVSSLDNQPTYSTDPHSQSIQNDQEEKLQNNNPPAINYETFNFNFDDNYNVLTSSPEESISYSNDQASSSTDQYFNQPSQKNLGENIHPILKGSEIWILDEKYYYQCFCNKGPKRMNSRNHKHHITTSHPDDFDTIESEKKKPRECEGCSKPFNFDGFTKHIKKCKKPNLSGQNSTTSNATSYNNHEQMPNCYQNTLPTIENYPSPNNEILQNNSSSLSSVNFQEDFTNDFSISPQNESILYIDSQPSSSVTPSNKQTAQNSKEQKTHRLLEKSEIWKFEQDYYYKCFCGSIYNQDSSGYSLHLKNMHRDDIPKIKNAKNENRKCEGCPKLINFHQFTRHRNYCPKTHLLDEQNPSNIDNTSITQ